MEKLVVCLALVLLALVVCSEGRKNNAMREWKRQNAQYMTLVPREHKRYVKKYQIDLSCLSEEDEDDDDDMVDEDEEVVDETGDETSVDTRTKREAENEAENGAGRRRERQNRRREEKLARQRSREERRRAKEERKRAKEERKRNKGKNSKQARKMQKMAAFCDFLDQNGCDMSADLTSGCEQARAAVQPTPGA